MRCNAKDASEMDREAVLRAHDCETMADQVVDPASLITYWSAQREFGVHYVRSNAISGFEHCPYCGGKLPASLRLLRFEELRRIGLEPYDELPEEYGDDRWWIELGRHRELPR